VQYCPECGGELFYDAPARRYACKSCGLFVTKDQLTDLRQGITIEEDERKKRKRQHGEYLEWWLSKK